MRARFGSAAVGLLIVAFGCENTPPKIADAIRPTPPDAGATGRDDAGAEPLDAGADPVAADAAPPNHDAEDLRACSVEEPCLYAEVQLVEGQAHEIPTDRTTCVLNALAARTPGRYRYSTASVFTNGSVEADHTLIVRTDGSVSYARETRTVIGLIPEPVNEQNSEPSQHCTLQPPSYFETCATEVGKDPDELEDAVAWACAFGDGDSTNNPSHLAWFEACEPQSPAQCE